MKVELRGGENPRGLVLIAQTPEESAMIDQVFGDDVKNDGFIGARRCEARLSDGIGPHYIYVDATVRLPENKNDCKPAEAKWEEPE